MNVATIDIGSNSIHLLIVEVDSLGHIRVIDREREMVRLGERGLTSGHLTPEAMDRGLAALDRFAGLARAHGCAKVIATATSAVREAGNGDRFIRRVRRRTGIVVDKLSGVEEARLIARAVAHARDLAGRRTLGIDIGGGSTEFWIIRDGEPSLLVSCLLGSVRLTDAFVRTDPISKRDIERLRGYIVGTLARTAGEVGAVGFDDVVVTSGTSLTLAAMANAAERSDAAGRAAPPDDIEGLDISAGALRRLAKTVSKLSLRDRKHLPGLPPERADIIVAGAVLLDTIFGVLHIASARTCDWSLREGVLLNFLDTTRGSASRPAEEDGLDVGDIRRRSVVSLMRRYGLDTARARQTVRLAMSIFDQTEALHGLDRGARELLQTAAFLHEVGLAVSHANATRHGQYLIMNSELLGYSARELSIVGSVVRYHGGREPKKKHEEFGRLRPEDRALVRKLTPILTLADALDRSGRSAVDRVEIERVGELVRLSVFPTLPCDIEMWDARRKVASFDRVYGVRTELVLAEPPAPRRPARARRSARATA